MAQKRSAGRRNAASAAARATASSKDGDGAETQMLGFIPADPEDSRLTLDGAKVLDDGKIDISAYMDLMPSYAGEPSPDKHPHPERPGVRANEFVPKGLRIWDDLRAGADNKDGAGWIAARCTKREGKKEKWFNIRTCGSWRLAFLLARLQRSAWERSSLDKFEDIDELADDGFEKLGKASKTSASAKSSGGAATKTRKSPTGRSASAENVDGCGGEASIGDAQTVCDASAPETATSAVSSGSPTAVAGDAAAGDAERPPSTPDNGRRRAPVEDALTKKRGRPTAQKEQQQKRQRQATRRKESPHSQTKTPIIGADVIAGSVRLQQILAARRLQEEQGIQTSK